MNNNLPKDLPNSGNNNPTPPPFGSHFDPHSNPIDPNNPYATQSPQNLSELPNDNPQSNESNHPQYPTSENLVHSAVASHQKRDAHGRFIPEYEQTPPYASPNLPNISTTPNLPNPPNPAVPPTPSNPPIQVIHGGGGGSNNSDKDDDNLAEFKLKNPFSKFFNFLKSFIKNQNVKITIPAFTFIGLGIALAGGGGIIGGTLVYFFPHNSPVFHREVVYQGSLQKTEQGFYLTLPNSDLYTLRPKARSSINFQSLANGSVLVKGNLTVEKFVIDVTEIIPLGNPSKSESLITSASTNTPTSLTTPNQDLDLPKLHPDIKWEITQKKVLLFTSGKRRIEQEGVYLESSELLTFPQAFLDYYTQNLKSSNFKQTLNSTDPDEVMITYAKDDLFLTFGVKNIYSGSGDNKKLTGYKAFIEHN